MHARQGGSTATANRDPLTSVQRAEQTTNADDLEVLRTIEQRVLWLASRIIDHANRRPTASGNDVKVGGHQASSASMVSIMTALWFGHLTGDDKVAVKPHASPVYHAIKYLTGELDRSYLTTLRQRGGLQAYPSRTKDPDVADFSTGSVGLGAVAPLFSALTRRYLDSHVDTPLARRTLLRTRRRRRTRRGQHLGSDRRPGHRRASATSRWSSTSTARASTG